MQKQDCRPNKALRTTTKAFLKRKLIERDAAAKKKAKALLELQTSVTSVVTEAAKSSEDGTLNIQDANGREGHEQQQRNSSIGESQKPQGPTLATEEGTKDIPQPSVEVSCSL